MLTWCKHCSRHYGGEKCNCKQYVLKYEEWYGDDFRLIYGVSMESAAEQWLQDHMDGSAEYDLVGDSDGITVEVSETGTTWTKLKLTAEASIEIYSERA